MVSKQRHGHYNIVSRVADFAAALVMGKKRLSAKTWSVCRKVNKTWSKNLTISTSYFYYYIKRWTMTFFPRFHYLPECVVNRQSRAFGYKKKIPFSNYGGCWQNRERKCFCVGQWYSRTLVALFYLNENICISPFSSPISTRIFNFNFFTYLNL